MSRAAGTVASVCGLVLGIVALALCTWVTTWRRLDAIALGLFTVGLLLSIVGYSRGDTLRTRHLAVVGIGCNVIGFVLVLLPYGVG
jgi:hypothetical protein